MIKALIVDINVSFLEDISRTMMIDERTDIEVFSENNINNVDKKVIDYKPDVIVLSAKVCESRDWNFNIPVRTYARNVKDMELANPVAGNRAYAQGSQPGIRPSGALSLLVRLHHRHARHLSAPCLVGGRPRPYSALLQQDAGLRRRRPLFLRSLGGRYHSQAAPPLSRHPDHPAPAGLAGRRRRAPLRR